MLNTEKRNPRTTHLDQMTSEEIVRVIWEENEAVQKALEKALPAAARAVDAATEVLQAGGRVFYLGAGTSGRLGVLDASECPPTFGVTPETFTAVIAGGRDAVFRASENAEDDPERGAKDLAAAGFSARDLLVAISASGGAQYDVKAVEWANSLGARTVSITNNPDTPLEKAASIAIVADTGPEILTGSTRMKAGTAQKILLNMISTASMVRSGHVYENMMINLRPTNAKLRLRMIGIVREILGCTAEEAEARLDRASWKIRDAVR